MVQTAFSIIIYQNWH